MDEQKRPEAEWKEYSLPDAGGKQHLIGYECSWCGHIAIWRRPTCPKCGRRMKREEAEKHDPAET